MVIKRFLILALQLTYRWHFLSKFLFSFHCWNFFYSCVALFEMFRKNRKYNALFENRIELFAIVLDSVSIDIFWIEVKIISTAHERSIHSKCGKKCHSKHVSIWTQFSFLTEVFCWYETNRTILYLFSFEKLVQ